MKTKKYKKGGSICYLNSELDDFNTIFHTKILCDDTDISKFRCDEVITDPQMIPKDDNVTETSKIIMSTEIIDEPQLREDVWRLKEGAIRVHEYSGVTGE